MSDPGTDNSTDESDVAVFDNDGNQLFLGAGILRALIRDTSKLMRHPLETGESIADHRVFEPIGVELSFILDEDSYVETYQEILTAYTGNTPITVQTRVDSYDSLYILEMPHDESAEIVGTVAIAVKLEEAVFVDAQYAQLPPSKVAKSSDSSTAQTGQKQSAPASAPQTSAAYALIFGSGP